MLKYPTSAESYHENSYKMWQLHVPAGIGLNVKFVYLDTEMNEDFVYIGTEMQEFNNNWFNTSGHKRGVWKNTTSNSIAIIFTSNGATNSYGFQIECYAIYNETGGKGVTLPVLKHIF